MSEGPDIVVITNGADSARRTNREVGMAEEGRELTSVEICAGAGGQAVGLEDAGFKHLALVEIDPNACETLRRNRKWWNVREENVLAFRDEMCRHYADTESPYYPDLDLLAGGVPCPPFSMAGKQLGREDERDLFPAILDLVEALRPKAVMIENVRGLLQPKFDDYRRWILWRLEHAFCPTQTTDPDEPRVCPDSEHVGGYVIRGEEAAPERQSWQQLHASDYGVPQLRPRSILVALLSKYDVHFDWPDKHPEDAPTVGEMLKDSMGSRGWAGASDWALRANKIAPTLVGGSKKHGGADLGPTRAKRAWAELGVDALGVADQVPDADFPIDGSPKLTFQQAAILQGFEDSWVITGRKTAAYRQVGNAFPPPVAKAVGERIAKAIRDGDAGAPEPVRAASVPQQRSAPRKTRGRRAPKTEAPTSQLF